MATEDTHTRDRQSNAQRLAVGSVSDRVLVSPEHLVQNSGWAGAFTDPAHYVPMHYVPKKQETLATHARSAVIVGYTTLRPRTIPVEGSARHGARASVPYRSGSALFTMQGATDG